MDIDNFAKIHPVYMGLILICLGSIILIYIMKNPNKSGSLLNTDAKGYIPAIILILAGLYTILKAIL